MTTAHMPSLPSLKIAVAALASTMVVAVLVLAATGLSAGAQERNCQDLSYNERIIEGCIDADLPPARGSRAAGADADLEPLPGDDEAVIIDRSELVEERESNDARASDPSDGASPLTTSGADSDDAAQDGADGQGAVLTVDPATSNVPIIVGVGALTAIGAAFSLAARRYKRSDPTQETGRKSPE